MAQPEKRFKMGACAASVFSNEVFAGEGQRTFRSVVLQKIYKDKDGMFRPTGSLNLNDTPKAVLALVTAYDYLVCKEGTGEPEEHQNVPAWVRGIVVSSCCAKRSLIVQG